MKKTVFYVRHNKTLVNANKCKFLCEFLPDRELLLTHLRVESIKKLKAEKEPQSTPYTYTPLCIKIKKESFETMLRELYKKFKIPYGSLLLEEDRFIGFEMAGFQGAVVCFELDTTEVK